MRSLISLSFVIPLLIGQLDAATVSTVIGTGEAGLSDTQVANPYGVVIGPDGALYFCDLDNQRIRRLDLTTGRTTTIAGNGERGYSGDGGAATDAALNMPHEIQFDLHQEHQYPNLRVLYSLNRRKQAQEIICSPYIDS